MTLVGLRSKTSLACCPCDSASAFAPLAFALAQPPTFAADRVLPSGGSRPTTLAPGMAISIYGA